MNEIITAADFEAACEVRFVGVTQWLDAIAKAALHVPHVASHKVVALKAMPPEEWALEAV